MRKVVIVLALVSLGGLGLLATRLAPKPSRPATVTEADLRKLFRPRMGAALPLDATFRDETSQSVTLGGYGKDRPIILVPVYLRCPSLCNEVLNELIKGLRGIATLTVGRDYDVVILSFDAREQPALARAKKTAYVEEYARRGSDAGWHFLTGDQAQIDRVLDAIGYQVIWDEKKQQFAHASGIVICTPQGIVARYFPGLDFRPLYLRLALAEAGQGTITPGVIDQVLLPCFVFDSTKGQYSASVLMLVKISGVLTVVALGLFWWRMAICRRTGGSLACPVAPMDTLTACRTTGGEATQ
jgi:protein SCO1/2